ncbi:cysteine hydrolase family protein [Pseudomarimonas salicorniae]|uniref:Isochorismatase family protein n=1 Tax=Pseudomarimonas salicorniae TaxID=2933270 RepID=A0ABT0GCP9_9GAMM|nr:isochorismatase family protein [Lysobacter sp. CAU 1642]MCK7592312.1 isochorismatase family protein [Lysobacter sp. CAU 1642]
MSSENRPQRALLVIDAQASFAARPVWHEVDHAVYLAAQNRLIRGFLDAGQPVVRCFHVEEEGLFSRASGLIRPLDGLVDYAPALAFDKHAHSALAGTPLQGWLTRHGINALTISGIRSEQCCETTTRDASDRGFQVDYVTEATLTFPFAHRGGRVYSVEEIRERCELVLEERFARIVDVDEALAALPGALASAA